MLKNSWYISMVMSLFFCLTIKAQEETKKTPIIIILDEMAKSDNVVFNYQSSLLKNISIYPVPDGVSLSNKIKNIEKQTNLIFTKISDAVFTITTTITLCGYIYDDFQNPLFGATINGTLNYTTSNDKGYFEIELESLDELVTIRFIGFKTMERHVIFFNLDSCEVINMTEQQELINPIVIQSYLVRGIDKKQDGSTSIDYRKFTLLPGLIEPDVLQTVQALPGVMSVDETVSNINIRGGSHDQNLILWDDIKMYQSGHFFGLISSFNPQITQTATLINNGTDASYTDGVSGTIDMKSSKNIDSDFSGSVGVNLLSSDMFLNAPLGKKSSIQITGRVSTDAVVRTPTYNNYFDRITQNTEAQENVSNVTSSNQSFNFYDTSLRWLYSPTEKDFIRLNFILINNDLTFDESSTLNGLQSTLESSVSQNSIASGLNYRRQWSDKFSSHLNVYNTDYKLQAINANVLAGQNFLQENSVSETAIRLEGLYNEKSWQLKWGYNFIESEVVNTNDVDLPRFVRRDSEVLREHAVFTQAQFENGNKDFWVRPGVRLNYIEEFDEVLIEPRLSARKAIGKHFEIEALGEFKHQNTSKIVNFQNDFLGIERRRWQLTDNDSIPIIKSRQASIGMLYKKKGWLLDAKAYYKSVDGITTQSQSFTTKYEFEKQQGSYDALGLEFLVRKKFNKLDSWLSYSYITNTYTFQGLEEVEFPSNFDITHSFTLGSTYSNEYWNLSVGLNYRTGRPTSIPLLGNEVIDDDVNFDIANNQRLQDFLRIDASALYKFKINTIFRSEIGASIWNVSNRENPINNFYRLNAAGNPTEFSRFSLGLTTNFLFRIYF